MKNVKNLRAISINESFFTEKDILMSLRKSFLNSEKRGSKVLGVRKNNVKFSKYYTVLFAYLIFALMLVMALIKRNFIVTSIMSIFASYFVAKMYWNR